MNTEGAQGRDCDGNRLTYISSNTRAKLVKMSASITSEKKTGWLK
jgi:hypothetical protein